MMITDGESLKSNENEVTKRFSDEITELNVDGLVENHWVNIHSSFNTCKSATGIVRGWWRQIE